MRFIKIAHGAAHGVDIFLFRFIEEVIAGGENVLSAHAAGGFQNMPALLIDLLGRAIEQTVKPDITARADARIKLGKSIFDAFCFPS